MPSRKALRRKAPATRFRSGRAAPSCWSASTTRWCSMSVTFPARRGCRRVLGAHVATRSRSWRGEPALGAATTASARDGSVPSAWRSLHDRPRHGELDAGADGLEGHVAAILQLPMTAAVPQSPSAQPSSVAVRASRARRAVRRGHQRRGRSPRRARRFGVPSSSGRTCSVWRRRGCRFGVVPARAVKCRRTTEDPESAGKPGLAGSRRGRRRRTAPAAAR